MIIVVGSPFFAGEDQLPGHRAQGLAARIALAAAAAGARVELVGKIGHDAAGDAIAVDLERAGVGHAALLRDPSARTPGPQDRGLALERADVELALRYLGDIRVIAIAERLADPVAEVIAESAAYAGAHRIIADAEGTDATADDATAGDARRGETAEGGGASVTVLHPASRDEGAFAELVGRYAARLDEGRDPGGAFAAARQAVGWEPARRG